MSDTRAHAARAVLALTVAASLATAQGDSTATQFTRPRHFEAIRNVPGTLKIAAGETVRRSNVRNMIAIAASTLALYAADDNIYSGSQRFSRSIGLAPNHPEWALRAGGVKLFYVPTTVSSAFYYLGDGWTTMAVSGAFFAKGMFGHDNRALRTASQITESMFALGIVTQTLKHATGRQTPGAATVPRGLWRPFAPWKAYSANTPQYDAFPSGHLATAMATVTVIALNYPEKRWVRPLGYSLMGALGLAMVNNGVHWASDYPLALGIGGTIGTIAARRGRAHPAVAGDDARTLEPVVTPRAIGLRVRF